MTFRLHLSGKEGSFSDMKKQLPGTLWLNSGRWNWRVKLPGTDKRKNYPLRLAGRKDALPESRGRSLAEGIAWRMLNGSANAKESTRTLNCICSEFLSWAETYYRRQDGSMTREAVNCEIALRSLREAHGNKDIDDINYDHIHESRESLIKKGLARPTINQRVGIWKRFFAWALDNRKCQAGTKAEV